MNPPLPPEALAKAQAGVQALREQLYKLYEQLPPAPNGALRFDAGDAE